MTRYTLECTNVNCNYESFMYRVGLRDEIMKCPWCNSHLDIADFFTDKYDCETVKKLKKEV